MIGSIRMILMTGKKYITSQDLLLFYGLHSKSLQEYWPELSNTHPKLVPMYASILKELIMFQAMAS